jgi:DNA-binding CsgD family transcriptional regulator
MEQTQPDVVSVIEKLYQLEQPRGAWLQGILETLAYLFDSAAGFAGIFYDISDDEHVNAQLELPAENPDLGAALIDLHQLDAVRQNVIRAYRTTLASTAAEFVTDREAFRPICERQFRAGFRDTLLINGASPLGVGCALNIFSARPFQLSETQRSLLNRVAVHLSTAYRLQQRLETCDRNTTIEAIFSSGGKLEHFDSPLEFKVVRAALDGAIAHRKWARGAARGDANRALAGWTGLVNRRWTLIDRYERDGKRYIVASSNTVQSPEVTALSEREREVVALAAIGRSNKFIAYELGLAHSTVRVLCSRAMVKLGVRSRAELIERVGASRALERERQTSDDA